MPDDTLLRLAGAVIAAAVGLIVRMFYKRRELWRMEGLWLEVIQDNPKRYSVAELRFNWRGHHVYEGQSYDRSAGSPRFEWNSIRSFVGHGHFMYIYEVSSPGAPKTHGFGFIHLPAGDRPTGRGDTTGYFADAEDRPTAPPVPDQCLLRRDTKLYKAEVVAEEVEFLLRPYDEQSRQHFVQHLASKDWDG